MRIDNICITPENTTKMIVKSFSLEQGRSAAHGKGRQNRWIGEYALSLAGREHEALIAIAQIAILDDRAARLGRTGFGQVMEYGESALWDLPDVGILSHDARFNDNYMEALGEVTGGRVDIAQEPGFVAMHGRIFVESPWAGRYNTQRGKLSLVFDAEGNVFYRGAAPEAIQQELAWAFEAYHAACKERPDLALAYAGILHNHIQAIHPFKDGNGRMARLVLVSELARMGLLKPQELPLGLAAKSNNGWSYPGIFNILPGAAPESYDSFGGLSAHAFDTLRVLRSSYEFLCMDDGERKAAISPSR